VGGRSGLSQRGETAIRELIFHHQIDKYEFDDNIARGTTLFVILLRN
jgi:hypothetical protein